jgi:hypothetical protein
VGWESDIMVHIKRVRDALRAFAFVTATVAVTGALPQTPKPNDKFLSERDVRSTLVGNTVSLERSNGKIEVEYYSPDRTTRHFDQNGQLHLGTWRWDQAGGMCFTYESSGQENCWKYRWSNRKLQAISNAGTVLKIAMISPGDDQFKTAQAKLQPGRDDQQIVQQSIGNIKREQKQEGNERAKLIAESERPEHLLRSSYIAYIHIKKCFEARNGYSLIYVTAAELEGAKKNAKLIEQDLKQKKPNLNPDATWGEANKEGFERFRLILAASGIMANAEMNSNVGLVSDQVLAFCKYNLRLLENLRSEVLSETKNIEKDF